MGTVDRALGSPRGASPSAAPRPLGLWAYLLTGILFGVVLTKAEVISWFRIQEMFRFQGFHMFGIFATALPTGILTVQAIKRWWRRCHIRGNRERPRRDLDLRLAAAPASPLTAGPQLPTCPSRSGRRTVTHTPGLETV